MDAADQAAWMTQWRSASVALDAQWREELRSLTAARALAAADAVLSLANRAALPEARRSHSGLVEQQRLLRRLPR